MITTAPPIPPPTVQLFNQITAKSSPLQKNTSDFSCSRREARLLPPRATVSHADFSNFLFYFKSSSKSQPEKTGKNIQAGNFSSLRRDS